MKNLDRGMVSNVWRLFWVLSSWGIIISACDGEKTQHDIRNAISLNENLKNKKNASAEHFSNGPRNPYEDETYLVKEHRLKPGESIHDVAILYGTDWQSILKANNLTDASDIKPGQTLLIPIKKSNPVQKAP